MKAVFFHDFKSFYDENKNFYAVSFNYNLWKDYLSYVNELVVCSRGYNIGEFVGNKKKLTLGSGEKVKFSPVMSYRKGRDSIIKRRRIKSEIKKKLIGADLVIVRLPSIIGSMAFNEAFKLNKKIVIELVGCPFDALWNHGSLSGKIMAPVLYFKTKKYVKECENVIYVTNEFLQKRYPNNKYNIGCSDVVIEDIDKNVIKEKLNRKFNNKKIIIGMIGNLDAKYKGVSTALKSIKLLKEKGYNIIFEIVGGGNIDSYLREAKKLGIENLVDFKGVYSSGKEIFSWLDSIDIYIQPSYVEGMPRATIEAMSRGCPIASSNIGGLKELISKEVTHRPKDYKNLARHIAEIIELEDKRKKLISRNIKKAKCFEKIVLKRRKEKYFEKIINT